MINSCRVCLTSDQTVLLSLSDTRNESAIVEILEFVSGVEIKLCDDLPREICESCLLQLLSASEIKQKVIDTEERLQGIVKAELEFEALDVEFPQLNSAITDEPSDDQLVVHKRKARGRPKKYITTSANNDGETSEKRNKTPNSLDFKCFLCDNVFDRVWVKNAHVKKVHAADNLVCRICTRKCKTASSLESHTKFHFRDYDFMCEICSKTFKYRNRLSAHMRTHAEVPELACDLCNLKTKFKNNILRHMKSVHMKLRQFKCDHCPGHEYSTQEALKSHQYRYHDVPAPIKCPDCDVGFTFDSELRAHKKYHHCSNNRYAPRKKRDRPCQDNFEVVHSTGEHICKQCNESFRSRLKWKMHNYLKHKFSLQCDKCNIVLNSYTSLLRHDKIKHQGIKPFKCEFCNKTFGQKVSLTSHVNTHTGDKTFGCAFCTFRSGDHATVSKHKKKMHPEMCRKPNKKPKVLLSIDL